jgi:hypothetical protein
MRKRSTKKKDGSQLIVEQFWVDVYNSEIKDEKGNPVSQVT